MKKSPRDLPKTARRVFKGVIFDVYHYPQKMFDGSVKIFERLKRPDTASVVAVVKDKIIILWQYQPGRPGFWSLPGGRVGQGESPLQAIKRELLEETGYQAKRWKLLRKVKPYNKIVWTIHTYLAQGCTRVARPHLDAGEKISVKLISFNDFLKLGANDNYYDLELKELLLRAKYQPRERKKLRRLLFGK